jgi:hypothetical protein
MIGFGWSPAQAQAPGDPAKMAAAKMAAAMIDSVDREPAPLQQYLSANCFGDYYTRTGPDTQTRELLRFAMNAISCLNEVIPEPSQPGPR